LFNLIFAHAHVLGHPIGSNNSVAPTVDAIKVARVTGKGNRNVAQIIGLAGKVNITGVSFTDVDIEANSGFNCEFTSGTAHNVTPAPCKELTPN
jgi:hypothetical protein